MHYQCPAQNLSTRIRSLNRTSQPATNNGLQVPDARRTCSKCNCCDGFNGLKEVDNGDAQLA